MFLGHPNKTKVFLAHGVRAFVRVQHTELRNFAKTQSWTWDLNYYRFHY